MKKKMMLTDILKKILKIVFRFLINFIVVTVILVVTEMAGMDFGKHGIAITQLAFIIFYIIYKVDIHRAKENAVIDYQELLKKEDIR